ncbi:MAG: hypothetical protein ABFS86_09165 [Planctomycetota bacterium]
MHTACRSCHAPPERPDPKQPLNDCANCHLPDRSPESLYPVFPDRTVTPVVTFDESVPEPLQKTFVDGLIGDLDGSPLTVVPKSAANSLVVTIHANLVVQPGRTDAGATFFAARARATVHLIRNRLEVEGGHAVDRTENGAREKAMARLRKKVLLTLTW